jgi:hypothetical protein
VYSDGIFRGEEGVLVLQCQLDHDLMR